MGAGNAQRLEVPVSEADHSQGPASAPVTLVEYGDFECPHCGAVHPIIKQLQAEMGDRLRYVFRNFPLSAMHRHAMRSAEAAEAAGAQGKYWPMHDAIFNDQQHLEDADLIADAKKVGLDITRFEQDLASHKHASKVQQDFRGGMRSGVKGTPTFFINGARYTGVYDLEPLRAAILETAAQI